MLLLHVLGYTEFLLCLFQADILVQKQKRIEETDRSSDPLLSESTFAIGAQEGWGHGWA